MDELKQRVIGHLHVDSLPSPNGFVWHSSLIQALKSSRKLTGRDEKTGEPLSAYSDLGNWLGAIGYFSILDQIGPCYSVKGKTPSNDKRAIIKCLQNFKDINLKEAKALYALRCALTHDYSLINIPIKKDPELKHVFLLGITGPLVELPIQTWSGELKNLNRKEQTKINLKALGDLVESIYFQLVELQKEDKLEVLVNVEHLRRYVWHI